MLEYLALNNCDIGDDGVEPIASGVYVCHSSISTLTLKNVAYYIYSYY